MARSSPGVGRVAAILNFIADHPGQSFALTDLVRALKLSRATCHALLTGLVEVGYLYRTSDKTYVLGPALAAIGRTAADHFSPLQVAQPEMRSLADEFDVVCGAYFMEGDTVHLRDRAASASHVGYPVPLGTRMKLRTLQAVVFFAWSQQDADSWLKATSPKPSPEQWDAMVQGMEFVREHGFAVLVRRSGAAWDETTAQEVIDAESPELPAIPVGEVDEARVYPLVALLAPIFDERGKVSFVLVMAGFHSARTGTQVMQAGQRLRAACERISNFVAGKSEAAASALRTGGPAGRK